MPLACFLIARIERRELAIELGVGVTGRADEEIREDEVRAENLREPSARDAAVELQLPQSILGKRVTIRGEQPAIGFGKDVRAAVVVAENPYLLAVLIDRRPSPVRRKRQECDSEQRQRSEHRQHGRSHVIEQWR